MMHCKDKITGEHFAVLGFLFGPVGRKARHSTAATSAAQNSDLITHNLTTVRNQLSLHLELLLHIMSSIRLLINGGRLAGLGLDVEGHEENNRNEGSKENSEVSSNRHLHALASNEERLASNLGKTHGHLRGNASSAAARHELGSSAQRRSRAKASESGSSRGESHGGTSEGNKEKGDGSTLHFSKMSVTGFPMAIISKFLFTPAPENLSLGCD
jgi:hypothetical protein